MFHWNFSGRKIVMTRGAAVLLLFVIVGAVFGAAVTVSEVIEALWRYASLLGL